MIWAFMQSISNSLFQEPYCSGSGLHRINGWSVTYKLCIMLAAIIMNGALMECMVIAMIISTYEACIGEYIIAIF